MKVRADLVKISKNLHTWVGITAGIFLFICFFAGGLTMFQHDLSRWATPPQQSLPPIHVNQYNQLITQVQEQHPEILSAGFELNFASKELHNAPMQWEVPHHEEQDDHHFDTAQQKMLATLNDQGQLVIKQENVSKVGWLIEQLHETAGVPGMIGHHGLGVYVMGVVAILYFLAIISGLVVLLPTLVKDFFAIRGGKNKKRFWLDTHNVVGITSLPFHIIIAITVIVFAFHDLLYGALQPLAFKDKPMFERPAPTVITEQSPQLDVEKIYRQVQSLAPGYEITAMRLGNLDKLERASAFVALYHPDRMLRGDTFDYMSFNPYQTTPYNTATLDTQNSASEKLIKSMFALHFGNYGGDFTRWLYFILGIGGAFLFYSGNILWVETRLKKQKNPNLPAPQQRKDVMFMANLTIGACLGCVLAVFASLLLLRWAYVIHPQLVSINHIMMYSYYALFVLSIAYTFIIGAAKALPQFFLAIALVLFTIPLTSIIAYLFPKSGLWHVATNGLIWIDIIAMVFALLFLRFYQQARIRAKHAPSGSIWSPNKVREMETLG